MRIIFVIVFIFIQLSCSRINDPVVNDCNPFKDIASLIHKKKSKVDDFFNFGLEESYLHNDTFKIFLYPSVVNQGESRTLYLFFDKKNKLHKVESVYRFLDSMTFEKKYLSHLEQCEGIIKSNREYVDEKTNIVISVHKHNRVVDTLETYLYFVTLSPNLPFLN
jgi:hypothetical protein